MLLAYVKPTNYCNVGCTHCYLPEAVRANRHLLSHERLEMLAELLRDMAIARRKPVALCWHGGEPLTVPLDWFERAGEILDRILPDRRESIQTSLIPLKPEHLPFVIRRLDRQMGSSIDFSQRKIKGEVALYHKLWMEKVDLARTEQILIIPGVVPTRLELGREGEIVAWFMERGFRLFNIDRYNAYGQVFSDRPSNAEHARFLTALYTALMAAMESEGWAPMVGAVRGAITGVLAGVGGDRWGGSCQSDFVVCEPDGGLNTCPDKSTIEPAMSRVEDGWKGFAGSHLRRKWIRHQSVSHKQDWCRSCENSSWCGSGCPITGNGWVDGEDECSGYKSFISHIRAEAEDPSARARMLAWLEQEARWSVPSSAYGYQRDAA